MRWPAVVIACNRNVQCVFRDVLKGEPYIKSRDTHPWKLIDYILSKITGLGIAESTTIYRAYLQCRIIRPAPIWRNARGWRRTRWAKGTRARRAGGKARRTAWRAAETRRRTRTRTWWWKARTGARKRAGTAWARGRKRRRRTGTWAWKTGGTGRKTARRTRTGAGWRARAWWACRSFVKAYIPYWFLWSSYPGLTSSHYAIGNIIVESKIAICAEIRTEIPCPTIGKA